MQSLKTMRNLRTLSGLAAVSVLALGLAGCRTLDDPGQPVGFSLVDPAQRHPILVSQQPSSMSVRVARSAAGLSPQQRAQVAEFVARYRAGDAGNSKLIISAPSGAANEVASMQAVQEIRELMSEHGFAESAVGVEAYHEERDSQPPIRISYLRYVAEGPECGKWTSNLAFEPYNLPHPNLGCANQRNFAAMVANPADLLGPRSMSARSSERRDAAWDKYVKGEVTGAKKGEEEKVQVKNQN
jgi:pilus assembly protein CpaD